ncbi:hypothetical protein AWJ20_3626 [Sugiyamaella lignohabitans]|uniref:Uncharacterized protein n=1 Tax=Sugiyamaella lignohabitans TaxID=796027 RepID=A0A170QYH7_9ASCO|nr:uncharacterized protein AWJ20_3626 [Sugiyamaella lignohabitans]ANB15977.1 hypothetical protein AWJ20_3626 [Sugiyamaella lignohabitans]
MGAKKVEFLSPDVEHSAPQSAEFASPSPNHVLDQVFVEPRRKTKINKALKTLNKRVSSFGATISRTTGIVGGDTSDSDSINEHEPTLSDYFYGEDGNLKRDSQLKIIHDSLVPEAQDDNDDEYDYYSDAGYSDDEPDQKINSSTSRPALNHYQPAAENSKILRDRQGQWPNQHSQSQPQLQQQRQDVPMMPSDPRPQVFLPRANSAYSQLPYAYSNQYHQAPSQRADDYYRQYSQYQLQQQQQQQHLQYQQQQANLQQRQQQQYQRYQQQLKHLQRPSNSGPQMHPQAADFMNNTVSAQELARIRRSRQNSDPVLNGSLQYKSKPKRKSRNKPNDYVTPIRETHFRYGDDEERRERRRKSSQDQQAIQNQFWKQYIDMRDDQANDYPSTPEPEEEYDDGRPGTRMSSNTFLSAASTPSIHSSVSQRADRKVREEKESSSSKQSPEIDASEPSALGADGDVDGEKPSKFSAKGIFNMMKKSPKKEKPLSLHEKIMSSPAVISSPVPSQPHRPPTSPTASHHSASPLSPPRSHRSLRPESVVSSHTRLSSNRGHTDLIAQPEVAVKSKELTTSNPTSQTALGEIYNTFSNAGGYVYNLAANSGYKFPGSGILGSVFVGRSEPPSNEALEFEGPNVAANKPGSIAPSAGRSLAPSAINSSSDSVASTAMSRSSHRKGAIIPPAGTIVDGKEGDSDVDDEYDVKSIMENSPPTSPLLMPKDPIHRPSSPLELTKSQKRFQKTMKFLFQKNGNGVAETPSVIISPNETDEHFQDNGSIVSAQVAPEGGVMTKKISYESLKSSKIAGDANATNASSEETFSLEPIISTFVELFRNCARVSFVLRPVDAVADAFPSLQNAVVVVELLLLMWLLYQLSIIVETVATAVKTFCMPVIIICRVLGITY